MKYIKKYVANKIYVSFLSTPFVLNIFHPLLISVSYARDFRVNAQKCVFMGSIRYAFSVLMKRIECVDCFTPISNVTKIRTPVLMFLHTDRQENRHGKKKRLLVFLYHFKCDLARNLNSSEL
jgi:hypothetical protein